MQQIGASPHVVRCIVDADNLVLHPRTAVVVDLDCVPIFRSVVIWRSGRCQIIETAQKMIEKVVTECLSSSYLSVLWCIRGEKSRKIDSIGRISVSNFTQPSRRLFTTGFCRSTDAVSSSTHMTSRKLQDFVVSLQERSLPNGDPGTCKLEGDAADPGFCVLLGRNLLLDVPTPAG